MFPVIVFDNFSFRIIEHIEELSKTTSAGLKNGLYDSIKIVDSKGDLFHVSGAKKIKGIGPLWGYNIFFNQNILVDLNFTPQISSSSLQDVKKNIIKKLNKEKYFWESGGNFNEIIEIIDMSDSIKTLIVRLSEVVNRNYSS